MMGPMSQVVLIAGSETLLGRKIVEKELARGNRVVAPVSSSRESGSGESSRDNLLVIPWNRTSLFSAKTVIQETVRKWDTPDRVYILDGKSRESDPFSDLSLADLDRIVDQELKGFLYLSHLIINLLKKKNGSSLFFVRQFSTGRESGLDSGCAAFFKEMADGIMAEGEERISLCGFLSQTSNADVCAESILEYAVSLPDKARGEWLRIGEKKNRFTVLPIEKRN